MWPTGGGSLSEPVSATAFARASVAGLLRDAARVDRTQSDPLVALRNAVGVAAPLAFGAIAGHAEIGLAATIGALQTAFADRPGPYRLRMLRMTATALAAGVTSSLAVLASRDASASVTLLLVLAFGAGVLLAFGPSATQVGVAGVAAALILGHFPQPPGVAVHVGLLVLAGGALQTVLAIAGWPLARHRPEREALARLYRELATAARVQHGAMAAPPASDALTAVRQTLYGLGHAHGPSVDAYRVLLDEAERIRREIVVLSAAAERLDTEDQAAGAALREALCAVADALAELGTALATGRDVEAEVLDLTRSRVQVAISRFDDSTDGDQALTRRAAAAHLRALSGQLRGSIDSTRTGAREGNISEPGSARGVARLRAPFAILRANMTRGSAVFRHALRLSLLVTGSDLVVRLAGIDRGYWVALTVLVVLRPDFAATLQRSVMRVTGTVLGLLAVTALVHWIPGGDWWSVSLIAALAFGMRLAGPNNVGLSALCLSGLVVVLLEINGVSAHATLINRSVSTVAGGALAVLATLALPAWERRFVPMRLADLVAAYADFVAAVADPASSRAGLQRRRGACRLARSNAEASIERARSEPVRGQQQVGLGQVVLAHTHTFINAMLSIEAVRPALRRTGTLDLLGAFFGAVAQRLEVARVAVLTVTAPPPTPSLRPAQQATADVLLADLGAFGGVDTVGTVIDGTDRITNTVDTFLVALRRELGAGSREAQPATMGVEPRSGWGGNRFR